MSYVSGLLGPFYDPESIMSHDSCLVFAVEKIKIRIKMNSINLMKETFYSKNTKIKVRSFGDGHMVRGHVLD